MSLEDTTLFDEILAEARRLEPFHNAHLARIRATGVPMNAEGDGGGGEGGEGAGAGAGAGGEGGEGGEGAGGGGGDDDPRVKKANAEAARYRRELREAQKKVEDLEAAGLTEAEKLKKDAEEGVKRGESGTAKLRSANILLALAEDHGLSGGRAKAAAKLLDGVEFNDDDEPKNLKDALEAAAKVYGEDVFAPAEERRPPTIPRGPQGGASGAGGSVAMDRMIRRSAGRRG